MSFITLKCGFCLVTPQHPNSIKGHAIGHQSAEKTLSGQAFFIYGG